MNTTSYYAIVTALQSISHIKKQASTGSLFNTEIVIYGGQPVEVPYVTGNAMKGILRRVGMEVMCTLLDFDPELGRRAADILDGSPLTQERLRTLFDGNILTNEGGRSVHIDVGARLSEMIPWLAVVGGCMGNTMLHGRIAVYPLTLICEENLARLRRMEQAIARASHVRVGLGVPDQDTESIVIVDEDEPILPSRRLLQWEARTHQDSLKSNLTTRFLSPAERVRLLEDQSRQQEEREDPDWIDRRVGQHVQMRYKLQTAVPGSRWFWRIDTFDLTPLMDDAFKTSVAYFLAMRPYVGGNRRQGMGLIDVRWIGWSRVEPAKGEAGRELSFPGGGLYHNHLIQRREEILQALELIAA